MDDAEKDLAAMIDGLGLDTVEQGSVRDLDPRQLMTDYSGLTQRLLEMGETLDPTTQEGRDVHSRRDALHHELIRRGLM